MSPRPRLRVIEPPSSPIRDGAPVQYLRQVSAPPGAPWRQRRIAELEARLGSPLADQAPSFRLTRSEPWRFGREGRFAVLYAHPGAAGSRAPSAAGADPEGNAALARLLAWLDDLRIRRAIALGVVLAALLLVGFSVSVALHRRTAVADRVADLTQSVSHEARHARRVAVLQHQGEVLRRLGAPQRSPARLLTDMDWVAAHRRPEATVLGFHWIDGVSAIETPSVETPFANPDRAIQRASHPLRPGVWLWGVARGPTP